MSNNHKPSEEFDAMFADREIYREIGLKLRQLVLETLESLHENVVGGAKVKLALYSRGGANNVLCGIQPAKDGCILYVHHLDKLDHPRLTFSGKGKHAKQVRFQSPEEVFDDDIIWLLTKVDNAAPY